MAKLVNLFSLLLAVVLVFSLTSCNEEKEEGAQVPVEKEVEEVAEPAGAGDKPGPVMGQMRTVEPLVEEPKEGEEERQAPKTREDRDFTLPPIEHQ